MVYIDKETKQIYEMIRQNKYVNKSTGDVFEGDPIESELTYVGTQYGLEESKKLIPRKRTYYILEDIKNGLFISQGEVREDGFADVILVNDCKSSLLYYNFDIARYFKKEFDDGLIELRIRKLVYDAKTKEWNLSEWSKDYKNK
ncbi:hypothetical protein [Staphylococcus shinii]|uniref:hypothetical protein n=1 Tax=Staphylococcus shinii TaxID=2912228 RepID=UPI003F82A3FC